MDFSKTKTTGAPSPAPEGGFGALARSAGAEPAAPPVKRSLLFRPGWWILVFALLGAGFWIGLFLWIF
ncbi:hypothetical protein ABEB22_21065 (plasmid) [Thioclava sp. 'Guangxiensis']|uniref:hypothetical protein n=1 Tax=Thioclava sp. 'Guangxiensis' TaxID=3149044 RepID=UPI0032C4A95E